MQTDSKLSYVRVGEGKGGKCGYKRAAQMIPVVK